MSTETTTTAAAAAADLLAGLDAHRRHYGAAFAQFMDQEWSATGATGLAWAIQAHAIASGWQQADQDAWTSWDEAQDWDVLDYRAVQPAMRERARAAGPDGHAAQCEVSLRIRARGLTPAAPADWRTVEAALDRLASEPAYRAVWAGWDEQTPRRMLGQSLGYHWPSDLGLD